MCVCVGGGGKTGKAIAPSGTDPWRSTRTSGSEPVVGSEELFLIGRDESSSASGNVEPSKIGVFKAWAHCISQQSRCSLLLTRLRPRERITYSLRRFQNPSHRHDARKVQQPIFGANNLTVVYLACDEPTLQQLNGLNDFKFCFTFNNGGCGTLLPVFFRIMAEVRQYGEEAAHHVAEQVLVAASRCCLYRSK